MHALSLVSVLLLVAYPAAAEVCDKVAGDTWMQDQGPVNALTGTMVLGWGAAFGLTTAVIALSRSKRLAWGAAFLAAFLALLPVIMELLGDDDITRAAVREGCLTEVSTSTTAIVAFVFALAVLFFGWMTQGRLMIGESFWKR